MEKYQTSRKHYLISQEKKFQREFLIQIPMIFSKIRDYKKSIDTFNKPFLFFSNYF